MALSTSGGAPGVPRRRCKRNSTLPAGPGKGDAITPAGSSPSPRAAARTPPAPPPAPLEPPPPPGRRHALDHVAPHVGIAHHAAAPDGVPARLELRLDQHHAL